MLGLPTGKIARTKVRVQVSIVISLLWILGGSVTINLIERWTFLDSVYFIVMTLTTVGLGDFVPQTRAGAIFMVFYCMFGLGIIAVLVNAIAQFNAAVKNRAQHKAAEIVGSTHRALAMSRNSFRSSISKHRNTYGP